LLHLIRGNIIAKGQSLSHIIVNLFMKSKNL